MKKTVPLAFFVVVTVVEKNGKFKKIKKFKKTVDKTIVS